MTARDVLRGLALGGVLAGVVDPGCVARRPAAVSVVAGPSVSSAARDATLRDLRDAGIDVRENGEPDALRVAVGLPHEVLALARTARIAAVLRRPRPHVVALGAPARAVRGLTLPLRVQLGDLPADGPDETALSVTVRDVRTGEIVGAADVPSASAPMAGDDVPLSTAWLEVPLLPLEAGEWPLCVAVQARDEGPASPTGCTRVDLVVAPDQVRIAVFEARPSWAARFARLALTRWDDVTVTSTVRVAPRITVGGASPVPPASDGVSTAPPAASRDDDADVHLVAGLDALTPSDVRRLHRLAEAGRVVILLADGAVPSGRLGALWPQPVGRPRAAARPWVVTIGPHEWHAREWLAASPGATAVRPLAYLQASPAVPVVWGRAAGDGHVVLVGALDTWRWRADDEASHDAAWQALVTSLAALRPARDGWAWRVPGTLTDDVHVAAPDRERRDAPMVEAGEVHATMMRAAGGWRGVVPVARADDALAVRLVRQTESPASTPSWRLLTAAAAPAGWDDVARVVGAHGGRVVAGDELPAYLREVLGGRWVAAPRWYLTRQWWYAATIIAALGIEWWSRRRAFAR